MVKFFDSLPRSQRQDVADQSASKHQNGKSHVSRLLGALDGEGTQNARSNGNDAGFEVEVIVETGNFDSPHDSPKRILNFNDPANEFDSDDANAQAMSPRMADFVAFNNVNRELERQLQSFSEQISISRRTWASILPYCDKLDQDVRRSDEIEKERDRLLVNEIDLNRANERANRELSLRTSELAATHARALELRTDVEQRKQLGLEMTSKANHLRQDLGKALAEVSAYKADIAKLTADLDLEAGLRETADHALIDLSGKFARLEHIEMQTRNRSIEINLQNDRLATQLPLLLAEQENRQNDLRVVVRERGDLQNRLSASQDHILQLDSEIQALNSQAASDTYTYQTNLEVLQSDLRVAERAQLESENRLKEAQKVSRELDARRQTSQFEIEALQRELEGGRREFSNLSVKLSDVNLKYMTDLVTLDVERERTVALQQTLENMSAENRRMSKFETLYKAAQTQVAGLMGRLSLLTEQAQEGSMAEALGRDYLHQTDPSKLIGENDQPDQPDHLIGLPERAAQIS